MQGFQRSTFGSLVAGACPGEPALAQAARRTVHPIDCGSTGHIDQLALGDAAMRCACPRITTEPLSVAAPGRPGWRVQAAYACGDETTKPRAGAILLKGPKP